MQASYVLSVRFKPEDYNNWQKLDGLFEYKMHRPPKSDAELFRWLVKTILEWNPTNRAACPLPER